MRKILLATTLLSVVVSENILMENHPRLKTAWICGKQLWNKKTKRIPRTDIPFKIEESLSYEDDRHFPRISDTRFISESRKLPPMIIRQHELEQFPQDDLSFDKSKPGDTNPRVLISIGIQEEKNTDGNLQKDFSKRKNYCKDSQDWQIQQPFYVEEPTWIDIDIDYLDSSRRMNNNDPYILTRGKKIYKIKNPERIGKMFDDYEATLGYPDRDGNLLIKSRVRRSGKMTGEVQDKAKILNNQMEERNYDSRQDINGDKNNSTLMKNQEIKTRGKRETYETDASFKNDVEKNETYISADLFTLSRDKNLFHNEVESSNKAADRNKPIERAWKLNYADHKLEESNEKARNDAGRLEINENNLRTDSQLINELDSKSSGTKTRNYREKRNLCKICKIKLPHEQDEWLRSFEKKIQESLSLERRDKHRDILERLNEPYIISRGKKVPPNFGGDSLIKSSSSQNINDYDRTKVASLPVVNSLLRILLETANCNNENCEINANELTDERLSPRDRRGTLDDILAAYDPYYVARGKRMYRNEKGFLFETDVRQ
ncbi:hypothetical protein PUN28_001777 [Cardiocondyla obscurior]|uniref:Uncharacterized protein n=1 Tax=Cardiocondyla obscurior TaxID=286306 RepID=A0AAW2GR84_9HYME